MQMIKTTQSIVEDGALKLNQTATDLPLIYTSSADEGNVERFGAFTNVQSLMRAQSLDSVGLQGSP